MRLIQKDERRWAFFYRRGRFTLGIASTQRCESFFDKLKDALNRIGTLVHLANTLRDITECDAQETRQLVSSVRTLRTTTQVQKVRHCSQPCARACWMRAHVWPRTQRLTTRAHNTPPFCAGMDTTAIGC
jgi:streptogramin lyase